MTKEDSIQCSQCGSSDSVDVCFAACVATTRWWRNDNSVPTTKDDIRLWRVALCRTCILTNYRSFLRKCQKDTTLVFALCSFALIIVVLFYLVTHFFTTPGPPTNSLYKLENDLLAIGLSILTIVGVIGVPSSAVGWIVRFIQLKGLERSGVVPAKQIDKSYIVEGQRIIAVLFKRGKPAGKVWGKFPLPEHKTKDEIEGIPEEEKKLYTSFPEIAIETIGKTIDEVEKQLPSQWKSLWERRKEKGTLPSIPA